MPRQTAQMINMEITRDQTIKDQTVGSEMKPSSPWRAASHSADGKLMTNLVCWAGGAQNMNHHRLGSLPHGINAIAVVRGNPWQSVQALNSIATLSSTSPLAQYMTDDTIYDG